MTTRPSPSALDPLSSSSLNKLHETQPPTKKRKIGTEGAVSRLSTSSIVIRAHAASLSDEPLILESICLIPRSRFPLSWLEDASWSRSDAQPGGLFVADIPALESDLRTCAEPTVLAVRLAANGGLYVVERVKRGIYSLSRLARWVQEGDVVVAVKEWQGPGDVVMDVDVDDKPCTALDALNWWQTAKIEEPLSDLGLGEEFAGLQVDVVFGSSGTDTQVQPSFVDVLEYRSQSLAPAVTGDDSQVDTSFGPGDSQVLGTAGCMDIDPVPDAKQSPEDLLNGMREHYLQALYISKTSLAYFAKGPLTRCRTAFQTPGPEHTQTPGHLIDFYREAVLAAKKMDLKYRESLPASVREAVLAVSDDEAALTKKRKTKKKLGKNGLYPEEDEFVRKWWKDRSMVEASTQEGSREAETKKHISDLRLRETQLQILLILEVMALESTLIEKNSLESATPAGEETNTPKKRTKKPQDLNVLLELHLDRLCIWHAVSMEESTAADSAKASSFTDGHNSGKKVESDAVRDFCTEVVIPFYASRLPDKCKLITRKFGVSGGISPAAKKTQSSSKSRRPEPGSDVRREPPVQRPRRSLQRVLTDERAAASQIRHPSLSRSKTAPTRHDTKRDSLEPMLPTVMSGSVRGGIQIKRVENREIDLNAAARQHESKLRKVQMLADQKKELDNAIQTLRKPNREVVARDIAEDASKRMSTGGGSSRKSKNPVRNPLGEGVQVMATPRGNRRKDAVVGLPPLPRSLAPSRSFAGEMDDHSLAESPIMIPSSTRRAISFSGPDSTPFSSQRASRKRQREPQTQPTELGSIQETPTRPPSKLFFDSQGTDLAHRPSMSSGKGKGLFRVPDLPAPRSNGADPFSQPQLTAPTTPVSSRRRSITMALDSSPNPGRSPQGPRSSMVTETPPKQQGLNPMLVPRSVPLFAPSTSQVPSSPAAMGSPVKNAPLVPVTPEKSQTKSIYEQLGWDDDEMDM
ncbi:uncharacterized protein N7496_006606 [Penicillium cataractarum]|uniref:DNA replication regulator Sld3 C-terminal domain-containing protein n=1 Tax=Penicillium cataractarum TaxID=2100454 RepID=A0A9W9S3S2_9EURO|nr:uncharacterized protein N7496_006606 [Penicillium cataractarum]KAJ5370514.1 hypothetical protein N7496_006606 [Penicillium cataractarum]